MSEGHIERLSISTLEKIQSELREIELVCSDYLVK
jgi:hypothetical protein